MAVIVCRKPWWHPTGDCENSDKVAARQLRKMKSDLFQKHGIVPAAQEEIMNRNASDSHFLRLPPEIRVRIYKLVLGGQDLWIGLHYPNSDSYRELHYGGRFYHLNLTDYLTDPLPDRSVKGLDIRLLRVCRQIFTETALLPYALNHFVFDTQDVLNRFEKLVRPGKKRAQKVAMGTAYSYMPWSTVRDELNYLRGKKKLVKGKTKR